jgi:hypothetical protein
MKLCQCRVDLPPPPGPGGGGAAECTGFPPACREGAAAPREVSISLSPFPLFRCTQNACAKQTPPQRWTSLLMPKARTKRATTLKRRRCVMAHFFLFVAWCGKPLVRAASLPPARGRHHHHRPPTLSTHLHGRFTPDPRKTHAHTHTRTHTQTTGRRRGRR